MSATDITAASVTATPAQQRRDIPWRAIFSAVCVVVPVSIWFARLVIMAAFAISIINVFGVGQGSNIGRGMFLVLTYTAAIFDKMVIAGAGAITAVGNITRFGGVDVSYALWFIAFLPCALLTIF